MIKPPLKDINSQIQYLFANGSVKTLNKLDQFINEALELRENLTKRK